MGEPSFLEPRSCSNKVPKYFMDKKVFGRLEFSSGNDEDTIEEVVDDKIKVFLRIKPYNTLSITDEINNRNYEILGKFLQSKIFLNKEELLYQYRFTDIFLPTTPQNVIFEKGIKENLKSFLNGENNLIFAYGTTTSGKTYTVQGTPLQPGLIPRCLYTIFASICGKEDFSGRYYPETATRVVVLDEKQVNANELNKMKILKFASKQVVKNKKFLDQTISTTDHTAMETNLQELNKVSIRSDNNLVYSIWIAFIEIYNENLFDLLVDVHEQRPLSLVEDKDKNIYVKDLKYINVNSWAEAYELYRFGKHNLHISHTELNKKSSRSHCLFMLKLVVREQDDLLNFNWSSSLTICDLAGSERQKKAKTGGSERGKEAQSINSSLLVLNRCIEALRKNQEIKTTLRVPFRESKLTRLFERVLAGEGNVTIIANMSQDESMFFETQEILKMTANAVEKNIKKQDALDKKKVASIVDPQVMKQLTTEHKFHICKKCNEKFIFTDVCKKCKGGILEKEIEAELTEMKNAVQHEKKMKSKAENTVLIEQNVANVYQEYKETLQQQYDELRNKMNMKLQETRQQLLHVQTSHYKAIANLREGFQLEETNFKDMVEMACQKFINLEDEIASVKNELYWLKQGTEVEEIEKCFEGEEIEDLLSDDDLAEPLNLNLTVCKKIPEEDFV